MGQECMMLPRWLGIEWIDLVKSILQSIYDIVRNRACQTTAYVYGDRLNLSSVIEPNGYETRYSYAVSYTHLDVYKRQLGEQTAPMLNILI